MKTIFKHHVLLLAVAIAFATTLSGRTAIAQQAETAPTGNSRLNIAVVATPLSSFASGDTRLTALNDGMAPRSSRDARGGSYGNWPRTGTQWVEYDWSRPISTKEVEVYWWIDGQGIGAPKACRLLYWDGNAFVPVASGTNNLGVEGNAFNALTFDEVTTPKLRLEMDSSGELSTGILEWRVYDSGKSPDFPPTVNAGIDRDVVVGGKTYLSGTVKALKPNGPAAKLVWSKETGPGEVSFADFNSAETTATFSSPGTYVLKLTAGEGGLTSSSTLTVKAVEPPPADRLDVVYTKNYRIDSPLWNARAKAIIVNWIPHCIDMINRTNLTQGQGGIDNFIAAARALRGEEFMPHKGYVFANAWVHQTVESMCIALMIDPQGDKDIIAAQDKMRKTLDEWIPIILSAQEPDGYLQTAYTARPGMFFTAANLQNPGSLAAKLKTPNTAITSYIAGKLSDATRRMLSSWNETNEVSDELKTGLVDDLNRIAKGPPIWDEKAFADVNVRPIVKSHVGMQLIPSEQIRLNHLLLEDGLALQAAGGRGRGGRFGGNVWMDHWSPAQRGNHEGYTAGYFIESAINDYTMTNGKDKRLYDAAKKLADCWVANIGPGKKEWFDGHQEMEQALVRFGRFVNDMEGGGRGDNYIKLAKFLLDSRKGGSEYDQSHLPVIQQYEAVGHAVRATYTYSGMADVAAETHDTDYQSAVMSIWDNIVNKKYYLTGGIGSGETSEGFGPNYSLRNNAYAESCSSCGLIFFQWKMNLAYHDAKYADLYEETMYNALLGGLDLKGENFYYDNPLTSSRARYPWHNCPCCVGNIPRTLLMVPTWTYAKSADGIYVNMFIGSTINVEKAAGTDIQMVQKTDYPWSGNVSITVNPKESKRFTVYVRVPNRTTSALYTPTPQVSGLKMLAVNGESMQPKIENGYAVITREWKAGDKIDLVLPMEVQRITADSRVAADRGLVALRYGPLIYNVERADHQDINKAIGSAPLTPEWRGDLLDGVMVIKGQWADGSPLVAIPNYARENRVGQRAEVAGGDGNIDYSGASGGAVSSRGNGRNRFGGPNSIVWIKGQQQPENTETSNSVP